MTDSISIHLRTTLRPAAAALLAFSALLGIAYPLAMTGIAELGFPDQARGSLVRDAAGVVRGSALVGQPFDDARYLWGRPSAIGYDATSSSGTNVGPTGFVDERGRLGPNPVLGTAVHERIAALRAADPESSAPIPIDLVTASASGLDPDVSPAAAYYQVPRIARARGVAPERIRAVVEAHVQERAFGVLGERRVNVLRVNLALDAALPPRS